jgi:enamine deaminase RidA (YjgF/YER057c/UK114 family)
MATRRHVSTGTIWEKMAGYSRAVRIGPHVWVSGTTASDENSQVVGAGDPYAQAVFILRKIESALREVGGSMEHVIRTRVYIVYPDQWESVARAHGEVFEKIRPANTLVTVRALVNPEMLVEIEAEAYIDQPREMRGTGLLRPVETPDAR